MKHKTKKVILSYVAAVCCLTMLFGVTTVNAGSLNPKNYFYVSVGMEISVTNAGLPRSARGGIGGTIEDWNQTVFAGSTVGASLDRRSGTSNTLTPPTASYSWRLVNKSGNRVSLLSGRSITIPAMYSGGYLEVTANTSADDTWIASAISSRVSIQ